MSKKPKTLDLSEPRQDDLDLMKERITAHFEGMDIHVTEEDTAEVNSNSSGVNLNSEMYVEGKLQDPLTIGAFDVLRWGVGFPNIEFRAHASSKDGLEKFLEESAVREFIYLLDLWKVQVLFLENVLISRDMPSIRYSFVKEGVVYSLSVWSGLRIE